MPIIVINICYRHTPQFTYPKAHNDAFDGFDWVVANLPSFGGDPESIVLGGISAGANIAAAVVLEENSRIRAHAAKVESGRRPVRIKGQILCIPWLVIHPDLFPYELFASRETSSRYQCTDAPVLSGTVLDFFRELMALKDHDRDIDVGLIGNQDVVGIPNTAFLIAGNDPLRDDGLLYAKQLHQNGYVYLQILSKVLIIHLGYRQRFTFFQAFHMASGGSTTCHPVAYGMS